MKLVQRPKKGGGYIQCDCGEEAKQRIPMHPDLVNGDVWCICEFCGEKESLAEILGMV